MFDDFQLTRLKQAVTKLHKIAFYELFISNYLK